ncbi:MAG: DNA polymerase III subunit delta [Gammaproteobacteria bacterium RIFCSPHIGHO2_12_FULL_38_11]|nr:MAG: DNA polymerase III subunit delta [Gammaproteobacteria bacterium RIFCSPHIGHO2_12_FULL_38_11]
MQLPLNQLSTHVNKKLSSLYLISGDESLLIQEARDLIIHEAKKNGFLEKEIYHIGTGFCIEKLIEINQNQSLFCNKLLIDIRNTNAKFDAAFVTFLKKYIEDSADDRLLIISTEKLTGAQQKTAWCELIKKSGVFIPVWPIKINVLPQWIIERGKKLQLKIPFDIARILANFTEGNLLSSQQALEKLNMLYPNIEITREQLISVLSDHARFNIFDLSESIIQGDIKKISRIIARLEQTGEEPTLVLWAICRKLRETATLHKALQKASHIDEIIKGARTGNVWQGLLELSLL